MTTAKRIKFPAGATEREMTSAVGEAGGFQPGAVVVVEIEHDDACPLLRLGLGCRCEPSATVMVRAPERDRGEDA